MWADCGRCGAGWTRGLHERGGRTVSSGTCMSSRPVSKVIQPWTASVSRSLLMKRTLVGAQRPVTCGGFYYSCRESLAVAGSPRPPLRVCWERPGAHPLHADVVDDYRVPIVQEHLRALGNLAGTDGHAVVWSGCCFRSRSMQRAGCWWVCAPGTHRANHVGLQRRALEHCHRHARPVLVADLRVADGPSTHHHAIIISPPRHRRAPSVGGHPSAPARSTFRCRSPGPVVGRRGRSVLRRSAPRLH